MPEGRLQRTRDAYSDNACADRSISQQWEQSLRALEQAAARARQAMEAFTRAREE